MELWVGFRLCGSKPLSLTSVQHKIYCGCRTGSLSLTDVRVPSHVTNVTNKVFFLAMEINCNTFESAQDKIWFQLWNYKGDQRENDVYREHKRIVCLDFTLIVTCQTLGFSWVLNGSLMLLLNVCLLLRWTKLVWKPQETRLSCKSSGTSVFCLGWMDIPFRQTFPQCSGATRLGFV